jgi:hypothetical protein
LLICRTPAAELDSDIAGVLNLPPRDAGAPQWSVSAEESTKLFKQPLQERPIDLVHDPDRDQYICSVKLYGTMPATPPYVVRLAKTAPIAVLAAMIDTLMAVELDYWS